MAEHEFVYGYEDNYGGLEFDTGAELVADLEANSSPESPFWHYNVPVWVDADYGILEVGLLLPRHGEPVIHYSHSFTDEDVAVIRSLMMRVWAMRADAGFARYYFTREPIEA